MKVQDERVYLYEKKVNNILTLIWMIYRITKETKKNYIINYNSIGSSIILQHSYDWLYLFIIIIKQMFINILESYIYSLH